MGNIVPALALPAALSAVGLLALAASPAATGLGRNPRKTEETMTEPTTRRIVLCLDGTWNSTYNAKHREDGSEVVKPSNVLKLCRAVVPRGENGIEQLAYYDVGVGSLARYPGLSNRLLSLADKALGGGWGAGFESNVEEALQFLALNYRPGDEVFVFGFSRGAATARAVTQFLDWSGGLPVKRDAYYLGHLFRAYVSSQGQRSGSEAREEIDRKRRQDGLDPLEPFQEIRVTFLGVWETVMALGSRFRATGPGTATVSRSFHLRPEPARCVLHARQALAVDEARYDFRPEVWTAGASHQTLEQRWFAGVHSNVGGGYVDDGLANLAFRWILGEAEARGLAVDRRIVAFFRGYAQDRLYRSESLLYRTLDGLRFRFGRGKRSLIGYPASAMLSLDRSVIHRICSDPRKPKPGGAPGEVRFPELRKAYRPENVLELLACHADLEAYLENLGLDEEHRELPEDVLERIRKLQPRFRHPTGSGTVPAR